MSEESAREQREHEITVQVFSISAAMIGVCLTAIGILQLVIAQTKVQTLGDELLAADAVLFVVCCFLCFWSFKMRHIVPRRRLRVVIDVLFMLGLVVMVVVSAIVAYAFF